jgi:hypothetical protein
LLKQQFTEVVTQSKVEMLKHKAVTQSKVADAETQSCYTVQGRQMLKHKAVTQSMVADAETQKIDDAEEVVTQFMVTMLKHRGSRYTAQDRRY